MLERQEIIDYALQYISHDDVVDFPDKGDVFIMKMRTIDTGEDLKDREGNVIPVGVDIPMMWGICEGYSKDYECKPEGKWIYMYYTLLSPDGTVVETNYFKLQPPHVASGEWYEPGRRFKYVVESINVLRNKAQLKTIKEPVTMEPEVKPEPQKESNIFKFHKDEDKLETTTKPKKECQFFEFPRK